MADDTGTDDNAGTGNEDDQNQNQDGADNGGTDGGADDKPVTRAEFDALFKKMQNADKRATNAEKEAREKQKQLDAIETAKLGDVEKAKKEAADAAAERDRTAAALKSTRLETAFIKTGGVVWHDPDTAYAILTSQYMDGVEIDDAGKVAGMDAAVKKLVKEKSFLVNTGVAAADATGSSHNSRKGDSEAQKKAREAELAKRMPAGFRLH